MTMNESETVKLMSLRIMTKNIIFCGNATNEK